MYPIVFGLAGLSAVAWFKAGKKDGVQKKMSPNVAYAFGRLLDSKLSDEQYRKAAKAFEKAGFAAEAELLIKRAKLAGQTPEEKEKFATIFGAAMHSRNPQAIRQVASHFQARGAVGAARTLHNHATHVHAATQVAKPPPGKLRAVGKAAMTPKHNSRMQQRMQTVINPDGTVSTVPLAVTAAAAATPGQQGGGSGGPQGQAPQGTPDDGGDRDDGDDGDDDMTDGRAAPSSAPSDDVSDDEGAPDNTPEQSDEGEGDSDEDDDEGDDDDDSGADPDFQP